MRIVALVAVASVARAGDWVGYPATRVEGAAYGRACSAVDAPPAMLYVDEDGAEPVALRLPGDLWTRPARETPDRHRVVLEGTTVGTLARIDSRWQIALTGGGADCTFGGFRAWFDGATQERAPPVETIRASIDLGDRLQVAATARAEGRSLASRRALDEISAAAVPALGVRAYAARARIEIEAGNAAAAEADLASASARSAARAFEAPATDAFLRSIALRLTAARGAHERAIVERTALDHDLARLAGVPIEDRIANRVYLAVAQNALRRAPDAAATLDGWMPDVAARFRPADPVRVDAVVAHALTERSAGRFREAQDEVLALLQEVARTNGTANLAYAELATRYALNAAVAQRPLEAIPALARSVAWFASEFGPDSSLTRNARDIYAYVLGLADRLPEAIAVQRQVVAAYAIAPDATPAARISTRHTLANFLGRDERYGEAETMLAQLLIDAPDAGVSADRIVHLRLDLAHVRWQTRGADAGCAVVDDVRRTLAGAVALPVELASQYDLLVALCTARVIPADGIAQLRRIVAQRDALYGADSVGVVNAQVALARAQIDATDFPGARATLESLAASIERLRSIETPDAIGARNAFAKWLQSDALSAGYRDLAYLYARDGDAARAIAVADAARARSQNDAIGLARDMAGLPSRDQYRATALAQRVRDQDAEIALLAPTDPARLALQVARDVAAGELAALARQGRDTAPSRLPALDLRRVRAQMSPTTAFIGLHVVHGAAWGYVVRHDVAPKIVMLDRAMPLLGAILPLRTAWSAPRDTIAPVWKTPVGTYVNALTSPASGAQRQSIAELADALGEAVLRPLMPHLAGITTLVVAVDAPLNLIPLDALTVDRMPFAARFTVQYAPSLVIWSARRAQRSSTAFRRDLVAIGAPDYAAMTPSAIGPLPARAWGALPGAAAELDAIAALFPRDRVEVATGLDASKVLALALARDGTLASARYVHVAAHGLLAIDAPQWSSIVLDGGGVPAYLTSAEIAALDIRADLVVLSACETALGKDVAGEGVFGLPYAFAIAGARRTLLTLWPVADRPTERFMRRLYEKLARGVSPAIALAQTKREFIRSKEYSAPFYWAPFVLYGS